MMSIEASARALFSAVNIFRTNLHPNNLLHRARTTIHEGYNGVSRCIAQAAHRTATPEEPAAHELQDVHGRSGTDMAGTTNLEQPIHNHHRHHEHALGAADIEGASRQVSGGDNDPAAAPPGCSRKTQVWLALLVVGALTLIVTPGLVLGIMTGQLPWGIALSGAIATVVSFLAGLYYHLNR